MREEIRISWAAIITVSMAPLLLLVVLAVWKPISLIVTLPAVLLIAIWGFRSFRNHIVIDDVGVRFGAPGTPSICLPYSEIASCELVDPWNPRIHLASATVNGRRVYHVAESQPVKLVMKDGRMVLLNVSEPAETSPYIRSRMGS